MTQRSQGRAEPSSNKEPDQLGDVLSHLFALRGYGRVQADRQLHEAWRNVAGTPLDQQTRVLGLKRGVLQIGVSNSALLSELASFRKAELLLQFKTDYPQLRVRDLKFRHRGDLNT